MNNQQANFSGSIPENYDRYLGAMLFAPYAAELAARVRVPPTGAVLELACGTGIVTQTLRESLPSSVKLMATDLNEAMIQFAQRKLGRDAQIEWRQADAASLPFPDESFDAVVCQFGLMFVPDKARAAIEAHRVLKPGGVFLFNVWTALERNPLSEVAHQTIVDCFEKDPPRFYETPFGYHDVDEIRRLLKRAGFGDITLEVVTKLSRTKRASEAAMGLVQGTPVSVAISERDPKLLSVVTEKVQRAIAERFGQNEISAEMNAIVVQAVR